MTHPDAMLRAVAYGELLDERFPTSTDPEPQLVNSSTGCLTRHGIEQATAALLRDNSISVRIIREQVKVYAAWLDDANRKSDDGTDACHELIYRALTVHGAANTWQDATGIIGALLDAHRNGVRL